MEPDWEPLAWHPSLLRRPKGRLVAAFFLWVWVGGVYNIGIRAQDNQSITHVDLRSLGSERMAWQAEEQQDRS